MPQGQYTVDDVDAQPQQKGQFSLTDLDAGEKPAQPGWLAQTASLAANQFGAHTSPEVMSEMGTALGSDLGAMITGTPGAAVDTFTGNKLRDTLQSNYQSLKQTGKLPIQNDYAARKAKGYSMPYALAAPLAEQIGVNVPGMEQSAQQGSQYGVLGHAAAVPVAMAVTEGARAVAPAALAALDRAIPSTQRAGAGIGILRDRFADLPTNATPAYKLASDLTDKLERQGSPVPPQLKAAVERVQAASATGQPVTFADMHEMREALNDAKYAAPDRKVGAQMGQAAKLMGDELQNVAQKNGFGKDWAAQQREYARAQSTKRFAGKYGNAIAAGVAPAVGSALGASIPMNEGLALGGMLAGKPVIGSMVESVIDRTRAGVPQLGTLPEPPPTVAPPSAPPTSEATAPSGRRMADAGIPEEMEQRTGVERRDAAARAQFAAMSPEEQYKAAYTHKITGLPNARAFADVGPAPAHGFSDVSGLKWLNDTYGNAAGDNLLEANARALQDAGVEAYHTGGDEFQMRHTNLADLNQRMAQASQNFQNAIIEVRDPATGKVEHYTGAQFRYGTGPDAATAEQGMMANKKATSGLRGTQGSLRRVSPPPEEVVP